jgi:hypothetical protein
MEIQDNFKKAFVSLNLSSSGVVGTASNTIDIASSLAISATTTGLIFTLPTPTNTNHNDIVDITNNGVNQFTIYGVDMPANSFATFSCVNSVWQKQVSFNSAGNSNAVISIARGTVDIGDPIPLGARPVSNATNIASATGLDGAGTQARLQINFTTPVTSANYVVNGHLTSISAAGWVNDSSVYWYCVSKSTTGFVIAVREVAGIAQSVTFDFQVLQQSVIAGQTLTAGTGINITNGVVSTSPTSFAGNITAIGQKFPSLTELVFDPALATSPKVRWNAGLDRFEIATIAGTATADITTSINFGTQGTTINGAGGVDGSTQGTPLSLTTTFQVFGDAGLTGIEDRTYNVWLSTGEHYQLNAIRKGTNTTDGWVTFIVNKIGVTTAQILTAGNGISITGGVIATSPAQKVSIAGTVSATLPSSTFTNLTLTPQINLGGATLTATTFTAPRNGNYLFTFSYAGTVTSTSNSYWISQVNVAGTAGAVGSPIGTYRGQLTYVPISVNNYTGGSYSRALPLAANQTVNLQVWQGFAATLSVSGNADTFSITEM